MGERRKFPTEILSCPVLPISSNLQSTRTVVPAVQISSHSLLSRSPVSSRSCLVVSRNAFSVSQRKSSAKPRIHHPACCWFPATSRRISNVPSAQSCGLSVCCDVCQWLLPDGLWWRIFSLRRRLLTVPDRGLRCCSSWISFGRDVQPKHSCNSVCCSCEWCLWSADGSG